jgi:hypothetical protein
VQRNAFFDVLSARRVVVVRAVGRQFVAADGTFVFFGDLAAWAGRLVVGWLGNGEGRAGIHVDGLGAGKEGEGEVGVGIGRLVAGAGGVELVGMEWRGGCVTGG